MYKFEHATPEEIEQLCEFLDSQYELSAHVEADLEWWMTGHWKKISGGPPEFRSMEDMLSHLRIFQ